MAKHDYELSPFQAYLRGLPFTESHEEVIARNLRHWDRRYWDPENASWVLTEVSAEITEL